MGVALDPLLPVIVGVCCCVLGIAFFLRKFKQPHVVAYIVAGAVLGYFGFISDATLLSTLGNLGIILLLFFVGMHIELPKLIQGWKIAIVGTILQIAISLLLIALIGHFLDWTLNRIILIGFVISLSSTAVVIKILEQWDEMKSQTGQDVLSILIVQDVAIVIMMITLSFMTPQEHTVSSFVLPIVGGALIIGFLLWMVRKREFKLPIIAHFKGDHELEIILALIICFGIAFITGLFGLSTALGAFVAGIFMGAAKQASWIRESLHPIHVIFMGLFFIYIGLLLDITFIWTNIGLVLLLVAAVLVSNTFINMFILKWLGRPWKEALYGGALLSQVGEFSFLLAAIGFSTGIITNFAYQLVLATIALSLVFTPMWLSIIKYTLKSNGLKIRKK